ncbi:alpha-1,4-glucan--maltose-1-phosphate maltosyltransferase [Okibacterium endophyticum]
MPGAAAEQSGRPSPSRAEPAAASAQAAPLPGTAQGARSAPPGTLVGRIPILDLSPNLANGRWSPKAFAGEIVPFRATAFREGHDAIGVELLLTAPNGDETTHRMTLVTPGTDRWETVVRLDDEGTWTYRIRAFADDFATWRHNATIKVDAGVDVEVMFLLGAEICERAAAESARAADEVRYLTEAATRLRGHDDELRRGLLDDGRLARILTERPVASLQSITPELPIRVERRRAGYGAWYEFFPRSEGAVRRADGSWQSGTFRTAVRRLEAIAEMGFDVVYLPPIHPIGVTNRKGPNNSLKAGPHDPGSPWAIGSSAGGHDAIHPDLGTVDDFRSFVRSASEHGLEVALDLALQASPDHPWVREHPEWFTTLPDGSIRYAENPPKKYQDIYPINFDNDPDGIRAEVLRIVRHWMALGVRIFRVDNPHTKPVEFWEWLIGRVNDEHPDVIFLAEAFTGPAMLTTLAKVGFQQSYTYFTWRNSREELEEFLTDIAHSTAEYLRPNLFVNTPDILTEYLQFGGPAAYTIRAAIAATAAPVWGVYSGYELFENVARPGSEENIDNEKYEYKPRDFSRAAKENRSLALFIGMLNRIRREHPALQQLRSLHVHSSDDDAVLVYSKYLEAALSPDGAADAVIVVANVDPHSVRETTVHLDLTALGMLPGTSFHVTDLITGDDWLWGDSNYVRLDAFTRPVHILHVSQVGS